MLTAALIARKRDGGALTAAEWRQLVEDVAQGTAPDYQVAALLMAVVFRGLTDPELDALTDAMCASGGRLAFDPGTPPRVDKHSTGGVGDKTSLILAPLVASCGLAVPMIVGRGLGHTGGTLDKLEAIPGYQTMLSLAQARRQVERIGCAIFGQTAEIAPADRRLYALRDATGTVESIPLIAASIMSKKLAEDLRGLVVDLKAGSGAFLPEPDRGLALARTMIALGAARGCPTVVRITAMDRPLGHACGNALETEEALLALRGEGPADLLEVTLALGVEMLLVGGAANDAEEARRRLGEALASGAAAERCRALIEAQGGNPAVVDDPAGLPQAPRSTVWTAARSGFVTSVAPRPIGEGIIALGGGRRRMEDPVDPAVGFVITAKPGQRVERGEPLATVHARDADGLDAGCRVLDAAIRIGEELPGDVLPLVGRRVVMGG
jgi:pyrimidine-nucleoside phosphorylase